MVGGADATKRELLRAIDVRFAAVRQDLTTACARASAAGFNSETVSELQLFSECFGAHRLNEACVKFISLCERRPDLINLWKPGVNDQVVRASWGSDMSIDDQSEETSGSHPLFQNEHLHQQAGQEQQHADLTKTQHHLNQSRPSTFPLNTSLPAESVHVQKQNEEEENKIEESSPEPLPIQPSQPSRRLSVQDRINLFENKQKENSGGKSVAVVKPPELRRLSSDVSSAPAIEKSVLRRWSGASDMSIDLGNDKKDNNSSESPLCTPSSSSLSQSKSNLSLNTLADNKDQKGLNDTTSSVKSVSAVKDQNELQKQGSELVGKDDEMGLKGKANWKDQVGSQAQLRSFSGRNEQAGDYQGVGEEKSKGIFGGDERTRGIQDQWSFGEKSRGFSDRGDDVAENNHAEFQAQIGNFVDRVGFEEPESRSEHAIKRDRAKNQSQFRNSQAHTRSLSGQFEGGFGLKNKEVSYKEIETDQSASQSERKLFTRELSLGGKNSVVFAKEPTKLEDLEASRHKAKNPLSFAPEQIMKLQGRKDESGSSYASNKLVLSGKMVSENRESFGNVQAPSADQVQRVRQSKGNQELNDELKMKANELEKLFAEHKQSGSTRRNKPTESQVEQTINSQYRKPAAAEITPTQLVDNMAEEPSMGTSDNAKFSTPPMKAIDQDYSSSTRQNFLELSLSDDSRGKLYEMYMQKRDEKLRAEWVTKRVEKEAKLKAMQESLERSRDEMKAKFSVSAGRSMSSAHQRAEKLRTYQSRSSIKREQHLIDSLQSEEDEDSSDLLEQRYYRQDRSFGEASLMDSASKISQSKKNLLNKNLASSTPRTTTASIPRSSAKISNPNSGRRRLQSENPLAQSVPNFSDFRKENTKPSSGVSKTANRMQVRTFARSKTTAEETPTAKEEKPKRSLSLRKSSASPAESKDLSLNSDEVLVSLKFDKDQTEPGLYERFSKNAESKPFNRKGNGIGHGAGSSVVKLKTSMTSDTQKSEEEFEESPFDADDAVVVANEEDEEEMEEEELETTEVEDFSNNENGKPRLSQESDKMSESENDDSLRSLSQIDPSSVAELPTSIPSTFHAVGSLQESPGESPLSWNYRMHNPFSYPHEISDIDASVDSPIGSPASWNSHSLTQTEADAARMRKKWGSAQRPVVANSSHNQSRKDVTKGFKRLLKFGRKSRGADSLADWISATTSEGDDDTEDGRDPANKSSEDLRKSRMWFSQNHASDDGFNESELFNEQVQALHSSIPAPPANFKLRDDHMSGSSIKAPRSFFSLSTFRSKGSESKLR
ncbi:uncharacterized protein LOC126679891 isoform X2 [Mercurialis annua]|nr:uncharacterized protein LOC126679891 isoform X2 [Mercurialis annua]